jgi:hypothetical protein
LGVRLVQDGDAANQAATRNKVTTQLQPLLDRILLLAASPRNPFARLLENEVPQSAGVYVIYQEESLEVLYVGKACAIGKPANKPDGLRFRIMENHLGKQGSDNFVKYVAEQLGSSGRTAAVRYIRERCSASWIEVRDPRTLFLLEHLAIAAFQPKLNRG